jgi:5-methylcytosine-specific restriction enzyme A
MYSFVVGTQYTRKDIFSVVGVSDPGGGSWYTGYTLYGEDHFIFCGVGTAGRTGHDYGNHFDGKELVWFGKSGSKLSQPSIQRLLKPKGHVYVFYRDGDREPFTFAGLGSPKTSKDTSPVQVVWSFVSPLYSDSLPNEIHHPDTVFEGAKKTVVVNAYERDPTAREKCLAHWGSACAVCDFTFSRVYGERGEGFIHVHHLKPLSEIKGEYELDPIADLRPVCPNCHAMLHRTVPVITIDALKAILTSGRKWAR